MPAWSVKNSRKHGASTEAYKLLLGVLRRDIMPAWSVKKVTGTEAYKHVLGVHIHL